MSRTITPEALDASLPQTQCQQCGYAGCYPYATALANGDTDIDRCPPGGISTLLALAEQLNRDPTPFLADIQQRTTPAQRAIIEEEHCIGCTKCLQVCPTDAIIGTHKQMHTVITEACTGCGLCLAPCPVDCITLVPTHPSPATQHANANRWRQRHHARQLRLRRQQVHAQQATGSVTATRSAEQRKADIAAAVARAQQRKQQAHE